MQALQGGLIGISTRRLRSHIRAKAGCELDSAQFRVSSYASGGPWRGVKAWTPGRNLLISLPQQSDLKRAAAGNAIGSASPGDGSGLDSNPSSSSATSTSTSASKSDDSFCIIEGRDTVRDFAQLQLQEIRDNINSRRNKIFLLMEEVRRLRIQQRIKKEAEKGGVANPGTEDDSEMLDFKSSIPFLPELSSSSLQQYYATCFGLVSGIILFGGLLAPVLELKLGLGGTSYADFINSMHLPSQLSQVDPIVASFSGGAVGVISALMVVEVNNVTQHVHKRCHYCDGTGYLACARCSGSGSLQQAVKSEDGAPAASFQTSATASTRTRCPNCAGSAKVMCPTCLCTGVALATEHDPRIDPFV